MAKVRPNCGSFTCFVLVISALLIAGNTGCGGSGAVPSGKTFSQNAVPPPGSVAISPVASVLAPGGTQLFTATVTGTTNTDVTWTSSAGKLSAAPSGSPANSMVSTAPLTTGTYTVTATSVGDPTKSATATVTVATISISPSSVTLLAGAQQAFTVTVVGAPSGVTIPITFSSTGGTLSNSGNTATFTAPSTAGTFTVTASVTGASNISTSATVIVSTLALSPASVTLLSTSNRTQVFNAVFSGAPFPVTFTASAGTLVQAPGATTATFTAPPGAGTYTITVTSVSNAAITNTATVNVILPVVTLYEVDGVAQANRPITFGRVFAQGDIANCPRPQVSGTSLSVSDYQADVKNRWPDGSVKFAIVSFNQSLTASSSAQVTFVNDASCNNTSSLTQAQMAAFNGGNWGAQMGVSAIGSTTVTSDAKAMLAANDPALNTLGDCKNDYWLQGPVVTAVIVQDCTAASIFDFGWSWNGTTMSAPVTGNAATASLHPMFVLYFYPSINAVQVESILENPWVTRVQDQNIALTVKTGSPLAQALSVSAFKMHPGMRVHKTFWSGTAPGHIRIDHNFAYLKFTQAIPNYDPAVTASTSNQDGLNSATSWAAWSLTDKGDVGGTGGLQAWDQDYSANSEGAPLQREDLLYLYNMGTCGQANGECAKAWDMLTGEVGGIDTAMAVGNVPGGAGAWNNAGNVNYHLRESRTAATGNQSGTNSFYCPGFADKNATLNTSNCGSGLGNATGKPLSRHAHSGDQFGGDPSVFGTVGSVSSSGWSIGGCHHWLDYSYLPYILTGDYYHLENEYQGASLCLDAQNPDPLAPFGGAKFFGFMNHGGNIIRETAWGLQVTSRAAFIAPDGTPEASYYKSMLDSTLEIEEGILGLTGTNLTPTDTSCAGTTCSFDATTANRWNWGRAFVASACASSGTCTTLANPLHQVAEGFCDLNQTAFLNNAVTDSYMEPWHYNWMSIALSEAREMGFSNAAPVSSEMHKSLEEMVLDSTFNPYLIANILQPVHDVTAGKGCNSNSLSLNPYINNYAKLKSAYAAPLPTQATFDSFSSSKFFSGNLNYQNESCDDHSYSIAARAAGSFLQEFGTSSNDANCPGGVCTASGAWNWLNAEVPYFGNPLSHNGGPPASTACTSPAFPGHVTDQQIKFAIAPR